MHHNRQRHKESPTAYSPEQSSPFSSGEDILQARFAHYSPDNGRYCQGGAAKENFYERQFLPIFKETHENGSENHDQMIAQLTVADSQTSENGFVNAILSDISDENLIKQLQLEVHNVHKNNGSSGAFTSSDRLADNDNSAMSQPFRDQTNSHMLLNQQQLLNVDKVSASVNIKKHGSMSSSQTSPQKHNFVGSSKMSRIAWRNSTKVTLGGQKLPSAANPTPIERVPQMEKIQRAPQPHPYPVTHQASNSSHIQETSRTQTTRTEVINASQRINQEEEEDINFRAYIQTNSDEKVDKFQQWVSTSGEKPETDHERYDNKVNQFSEPSTIEEQFTQEQLQASLSGGPTYRNYNFVTHNQKSFTGDKSSSCAHYVPRKHVPVQEPQILSPQAAIQIENQCDSESLEQIKLISQAIQKVQHTHGGNYKSQEGERDLNTSSSLKDFSHMEDNDLHQTFNDYYNHRHETPMMLDFDRKATKQVNVTSHQIPSQLSMAVLQDALSANNMSSSSRQQAITHFIQMAVQQQIELSNSHCSQRQGGCCESTLLCQSNLSVNQCKPTATVRHQSCENASTTKQALPQQHNQFLKTPSSVVPTPGGLSPVRQRLYVQGQAPSSQLYMPVLRQSVRSSIQKNSSKKLDKNGSVSQFAGAPVASKTDSVTPLKGGCVSPTPQAPTHPSLARKAGDRVPVKRNLEQQFTRTQSSISPPAQISETLSRPSQNVRNQKRQSNPPARETVPRHYQPKSSRLTPSPAPQKTTALAQRNSRNDTIQVTRTTCQVENVPSKHAPQRSSIQPRTASTQTLEVPTSSRPMQRPATVRPNKPIASQLGTSNSRQSGNPTRSPTPTRRQTLGSTTQRQLYDHPQMTLTRPTLPAQPQLKASPYQVRRAAEAMKGLDIQMFLELERIKKPQAAVLAIARMSCIFFEALRNRDAIIMDQVETMQSWSQIQEYMRSQLTCCVPELRTLLKQKLVSLGRINATDETPHEVEIEMAMEKIFENFFSESKVRVIRRFVATSKAMKGLVYLIYAFICLTLDLEREFSFDNMLGLTEQPQTRIEDLKFLFHPPSTNMSTSINSALNAVTNKTFENNREGTTRVYQGRDWSNEGQSFTNDQNMSCCSKCSCHIRQSSGARRSLNNSRSYTAKQSANRQMKTRQSQEMSPAQNLYEIQGNVFQTLDTVYVEQNSYRSRQSNQQNALASSAKPAVRPEDEQYRMSLQNYTTQQVITPKVYQQKAKSKNSLNADDLVTVMEPKPRQEAATKTMTARRSVSPATAQDAAQTSRQSSRQVQSFLKLAKQEKVRSRVNKIVSKSKRLNGTLSSSRSDFSSVVRGATPTPPNKSQNLTPKTGKTPKRSTDLTPSRSPAKFAVICAPKKTDMKMNSIHGANTYRHVTNTQPQQVRKSVSPVNTTSRRQLQKSASNLSSLPQKKLVMAPQAPSKHQRTSTLYKNTASRTAKLKDGKPVSSKSPLQRDVSAKALKPQLQIKPSQAAQTKLQSRKTKSQTNMRTVKRIPNKDAELHASVITRQQQRKDGVKRAFESLHQEHVESVATSYLPNPATNFHPIAIHDRTDVVRDTGIASGRHQYQTTFDDRRYSAAFAEEGDEQDGYTKRTMIAPPQEGFTPENETFMEVPDSSARRNSASNMMQLNPFEHAQQMTGQLGGKQNSAESSAVSLNSGTFSYIAEPKKTIPVDTHKTDFFMQKAQAITENINSCYKEHNMPRNIDMATINKLKMRRLNFMQQVYEGESTRTKQATQQSCNVLTTMTMEHTVSDEDEQTTQQENSFTVALNKLKDEVACLMEQRMSRRESV